ncbi:hypothetical protein CB1_001331004 [Camelus ferus]|nr:hypothetical protein CB1_001331004 [Camelus ferus]
MYPSLSSYCSKSKVHLTCIQMCCTAEDVSLHGYKKYLLSQSSPAPLTAAEEELRQIKINEVQTDVSVDTKHQTLQGVAFPISREAFQALEKLNNRQLNYVQLIEIDDGDELTADFLYEEVHPKQHAHKQSFAKPKGPPGKRGIRRLIRGPAETEATTD